MAMDFIVSSDLISEDLAYKIGDVLSGKKYLHICRNSEIKKLREENAVLNTLSKRGDEGCSKLLTCSEFRNSIIKGIDGDKDISGSFIERNERIFILTKVINRYFSSDIKRLNMFHSMRNSIYELFDFLLSKNICISGEALQLIKENFSNFESDLINLYQLFFYGLKAMENGDFQRVDNIIGENIIRTKAKSFDKYLAEELSRYDTILFDGFTMLNEGLKKLIRSSLENNIDVYLTVKINNDKIKCFTEYIYPALFEEMNQQYKKPAPVRQNIDPKTALDFAKLIYPIKSKEEVLHRAGINLRDESVQFVRAFNNRDEEFRYIAHKISEILEGSGGRDLELIKQLLKTDIAVLGNKKDMAGLDDAFKEEGIFVYKSQDISDMDIPSGQFSEIYFRKADFLREKIYYKSGTELGYEEKYRLFKKVFSGIEADPETKKLSKEPVGRYLYEFYSIVLNGINAERLKNLLAANYNSNGNSSLLYDFENILIIAMENEDLSQWIIKLKSIEKWKKDIENKSIYKYHPISLVSWDNLTAIKDIVVGIAAAVEKVKAYTGSFDMHMKLLKEEVLKIEESNSKSVAAILETLFEKHSNMKIINEMDAKYFAESIIYMLGYNIAADKSDLSLNLISADNTIHYKYVFLPMFESDRYPVVYKQKSPYMDSIIEILSDEKYGIQSLPCVMDYIGNNGEYGQYQFKNILDFTDERLTFTMSKNADGKQKTLSHNGIELAVIFGGEIPWIDEECVPETDRYEKPESLQKVYIPVEKSYHLTDIMKYCICPKMYYYLRQNKYGYTEQYQLYYYFRAILYSATLGNFKYYNDKSGRVYSIKEKDALPVLSKFFTDVYDKHKLYFPMLTGYELNEIKDTVWKRLTGFIENIKKEGVLGNRYKVLPVNKEYKYRGSRFDLILDYDTIIVDMENKTKRIIQNDLLCELLVLKSLADDSPKPVLRHYDELAANLDENAEDCDRVNNVYRMLRKVNIQYAAGYVKDAKLRSNSLINKILETDFSVPKSIPSPYCKFCMVKFLCRPAEDCK